MYSSHVNSSHESSDRFLLSASFLQTHFLHSHFSQIPCKVSKKLSNSLDPKILKSFPSCTFNMTIGRAISFSLKCVINPKTQRKQRRRKVTDVSFPSTFLLMVVFCFTIWCLDYSLSRLIKIISLP